MITLNQYFGTKPHAPIHEQAALELLERVGKLTDEAIAEGAFQRAMDPDTGTEISGSRGGTGDGGYRMNTSITGKPGSAHKEGKGVDVYDPADRLDLWIHKFEDGKGGNTKLAQYDLYREHMDDTPGWCHLQTRSPASGRRTFKP